MKNYFIQTTDEDTAKKLTDMGAQLIYHLNSLYVFLNDMHLNMSAIGSDKYIYTDKYYT